jgi:arabinofuranosyltransferase
MDSRRRKICFALVGLASLALVAHSLVWNFVTDDAFISFVYSRNLARHGQLVFNLGERVEGYTNFLWTVILAGLLKVGLQPELMSRLLGSACGVLTLFVCARLSRAVRFEDGSGREAVWSSWDALPALLLATLPGYACWSSGGLETQLFTFLVTLGMTMYLSTHLEGREPSAADGLVFGLAALTRPEGLLFFTLVGAHRLLVKFSQRRLAPSRAELMWFGVFALFVLPHFVWRHWYYGYWLPNTYYIKASGGVGTWAQGGYYLMRLTEQFHLWMVPLVVALGLILRRPRGALELVAFSTWVVGVFFLYVASVGGDFMGLFRFAMPVIPLVVVVATTGLRLLLSPLRTPALQTAVLLLLFGGHVAHAAVVDRRSLVIGADRGIDSPGFLRWYTADRAAIGKWFGQFAQPDDYAAVGGAGAQVYYSGMRSLDCFGLSDAHIAHEVRPVSNRPGHQKYAPLDYQLARRPTIITSNYYRIAPQPYHPSSFEETEWRRRGYRYVSVRIEGLSSPYYSFLLRTDRVLGPIAADEPSPSWQWRR